MSLCLCVSSSLVRECVTVRACMRVCALCVRSCVCLCVCVCVCTCVCVRADGGNEKIRLGIPARFAEFLPRVHNDY